MFAIGFAVHYEPTVAMGSVERNALPDSQQTAEGVNDDNACSTGLHCSSTLTCAAECGPTVGCQAGSACSAKGRCRGSPKSARTDGAFGGGDGSIVINPGDGAVPRMRAQTSGSRSDKVTPTVLFLIDQSQSMSDFQFPTGSGVTRWDALRSALTASDGIIKKLENDVSFGVSIYSWEDQPLDPMPMLINVPWKKANYTDINAVYSVTPTSDNTPTAESIMSIVGFNDAGVINDDAGFASATTSGPKILVLATDGDPDTCADENQRYAAAEGFHDLGGEADVRRGHPNLRHLRRDRHRASAPARGRQCRRRTAEVRA